MTDSKTSFLFPHPELTLIGGHPTPLNLTKLWSEVYDNAMSIPTAAGGSIYGHFSTVMPVNEYNALKGAIAYDIPAHPGIQAPTPLGATTIQISQTNCNHDKALEHFTTHNNVVIALKQQILAAVNDHCFEASRPCPSLCTSDCHRPYCSSCWYLQQHYFRSVGTELWQHHCWMESQQWNQNNFHANHHCTPPVCRCCTTWLTH